MKEIPMDATTVLRLPWFSIQLVRPRKTTRRRAAASKQRPMVRIAGLR
jgi:hypothetical protein